MIYLYSKCQCIVCCEGKNIQLLPGVLQEVKNIKNEICFIYAENCFPVSVNFFEVLHLNKKHNNIEKVEVSNDVILLINCLNISCPHNTQFKCGNQEFNLSVSNNIILTINGENVMCEQIECELIYSHFEQLGGVVLIYLKGNRNFAVVLENKQVIFADFYDEINVEKETRYFMKKQRDLLNHGKVCKVENNKAENYLVYLDDNELKMKNSFVFLVFLDCYLVKNFKYCNQLLSESIKQKDANNISRFFEDFDYYVPFKNYAITLKKNTLAGVYKFEVDNNYISNIIHL